MPGCKMHSWEDCRFQDVTMRTMILIASTAAALRCHLWGSIAETLPWQSSHRLTHRNLLSLQQGSTTCSELGDTAA